MNCPDCQAEFKGRPAACPECGIELRAPAPRPQQSDAVKYMVIAVSIIAVLIVLGLVASNMGGGPCPECRGKGNILCENCKDGNKCLQCKGTGNDLGTFSTCQVCLGKKVTTTCMKCKGSPSKQCRTCSGSGQVGK